ncbi:hypothetical protein AB0M32_36180 [Streptomyces sp. NPDC051985]|uniref:hypothetical protein n=1 Tax=Streptomyces sp. NPDC051985 TaxID=3155807 RepID=UPI0034258ADF
MPPRRDIHGALDDMTVIVSPVGADADLRAALEDLRLGRYAAARDLLVMTGQNWALRTSRSQLLAAGAGEPGIFKMWLDEEPDNPDAAMMWARVLTRAALDAYRRGKPADVLGRAAQLAAQACQRASDLLPACPVPWVDRLQLTQLPYKPKYFDPHADSRPEPWDMLPRLASGEDHGMYHRGPWHLLLEADARHPGNREAHHQMRRYLQVRRSTGAAMDFSCWTVLTEPPSPELWLLPVYASVDKYRTEHSDGSVDTSFWQTAGFGFQACRAYDEWFAKIPPAEYPWVSMTDLSHLAHALTASGETQKAAAVFRAMGPYVTAQPWKDVNTVLGRTKAWEDEFLTVRASTLLRWPAT